MLYTLKIDDVDEQRKYIFICAHKVLTFLPFNGLFYKEENSNLMLPCRPFCSECDNNFYYEQYFVYDLLIIEGILHLRCARCSDKIQLAPIIYDYDYDVMQTLINHGSEDELCFGVEYEVKPPNRRDLASKVYLNFEGKALCLNDGSLRDDDGEGLEIVTAPMPFEMQRSFWKDFFSKSFEYESYNHPACGIHIHMSRAAFSPIQLAKFKTFFYALKNRSFIEAIAGRKLCEGWGMRYSKLTSNYKLTDLVYPSTKKIAISINPDPERYAERAKYTAVNCNNAHTIEIRIFKGCNKLSTMLKNIEFCKAMYDFTKYNLVPISRIYDAVPEFVKFVSNSRKEFPILNKFIIAHKLGDIK